LVGSDAKFIDLFTASTLARPDASTDNNILNSPEIGCGKT
jgi:hypothetical protein